MSSQILQNIVVLDMATGIAGPVAAMLLAEAGATVLKIEPAGGDPDRDRPGFAVWNRSKESLALDPSREKERFRELAAKADILIHSYTPAEVARLGLDWTAFERENSGLIICSVAGYPEGHACEDLPPLDTLVLARSGLMDEQKGVRRDGPIYLRFPLGSWGAAYLAANGALARLIARERGARAGRSNTTLLQGALLPMAMHWYDAEKPTESLKTGMPKTMVPSLFECSDGVWIHVMSVPDKAPLMARELADMGEEAVRDANERAGQGHRTFPNWGANQIIMKKHPHKRWLEDFWANDVSAQPALPMGDLYFDRQAVENGYVIEVEDSRWKKTRQPGVPFTTEPASSPRGPAPSLGSFVGGLPDKAAPPPNVVPGAVPAEKDAPLAGVRVLDFGNFLAGPLAAMLLSDLGADVIKIEATSGDMMRWVESAFVGCQRGKRSLALQLKDPASREVLEALVKSADVVHHNLRMPAATKLGLDYESLRAINPRIIFCHVSSYGPKGERKDWPGYDQLFQASSGWEYEGAGEGNKPMWHRFGMMDHQGALASLTATLLALYHRDKTGQGQSVNASLLGASILTMSETMVGSDGKLLAYDHLDAEQTHVRPEHGIFQCQDGWLAVAGLRDIEREALFTLGGASDRGGLERFFSARTRNEALKALREKGVPCTAVLLDQKTDFIESAENRNLGLVAEYSHKVYGRFRQIGSFWSMPDLDMRLNRAPPGLGEHSREILREVGFDESRIERFMEDKTVA